MLKIALSDSISSSWSIFSSHSRGVTGSIILLLREFEGSRRKVCLCVSKITVLHLILSFYYYYYYLNNKLKRERRKAK